MTSISRPSSVLYSDSLKYVHSDRLLMDFYIPILRYPRFDFDEVVAHYP